MTEITVDTSLIIALCRKKYKEILPPELNRVDHHYTDCPLTLKTDIATKSGLSA